MGQIEKKSGTQYIKQPLINILMSLYSCLIQPILDARAEKSKNIC